MKKVDDGNNLVLNDQIVEMLSQAIYRGAAALKYVPELVKDLIIEKRWERRVIRRTGEAQTFADFEDFVTAQPLEGLGTDMLMLRSLCAGDPEALRLIDKVTQDPHGKFNSPQLYLLSSLGQERPELAGKVLDGDLSLKNAAIKLGFQERRTRLFPADVDDTAEKIIKVFELEWGRESKGALRELVRLLNKHIQSSR